jgi:hypothetical protein
LARLRNGLLHANQSFFRADAMPDAGAPPPWNPCRNNFIPYAVYNARIDAGVTQTFDGWTLSLKIPLSTMTPLTPSWPSTLPDYQSFEPKVIRPPPPTSPSQTPTATSFPMPWPSDINALRVLFNFCRRDSFLI